MLRCPVCQSEKDERSFIETYVSSFNNQEYKLYHCETCDLQWWEPLKIIPEFYEMEGDEAYKLSHMGLREEIGENHKMFFKYIPLKSGRLLDIGCGDGVFLKEAQKAGFEVWGIDFDSKSIKVCQEKWGLKNTFVMSPQEFAEFCQKEGLKFDVITFFEVLEHQDKPVEFLEAIKSMLKPGGYIAGSVPNRESLLVRMDRKVRPVVDFPPHHFLRFSSIAVYSLLKKSFNSINIVVSKVKLIHVVANIQLYITGKKMHQFIQKKLLGYSFEEVGDKVYKEAYSRLSIIRKIIIKGLKILRFLFLLPIAFCIKLTSSDMWLYFQASSKE